MALAASTEHRAPPPARRRARYRVLPPPAGGLVYVATGAGLYVGTPGETREVQLWLPRVPVRSEGPNLVRVGLVVRTKTKRARREQLALPGILDGALVRLPLVQDRTLTPCEAPTPRRVVRKLPVIGCSRRPPEVAMRKLAEVSIPTEETDTLNEAIATGPVPLLPRPRTRADCAQGPRPCPWVGCRHHLYLDVHPGSGSIKLNHPETALEDMAESCALDVADRGATGLLEIGRNLGVTLERARQMVVEALGELRDSGPRAGDRAVGMIERCTPRRGR